MSKTKWCVRQNWQLQLWIKNKKNLMNKEIGTWRFIDSGARDGAFNMAADETLARVCETSRPILRVYAWRPYAISIGHHQKLSEVDLDKCTDESINVVRRPTGGRAIFHAQEVTYAVIIPKDSSLYLQSTLDIYNLISSALVNGLNRLGTNLVLERKENVDGESKTYNRKFACFASSAKYEIQYRSTKLVGSAQRRLESGLLQHGSILLGNEHLNLFDYLTETNGNSGNLKQILNEKTTCLETILNRKLSYNEIVSALKSGFEDFFKIELQSTPLDTDETELINEHKQQYSQTRRDSQCETYV